MRNFGASGVRWKSTGTEPWRPRYVFPHASSPITAQSHSAHGVILVRITRSACYMAFRGSVCRFCQSRLAFQRYNALILGYEDFNAWLASLIARLSTNPPPHTPPLVHPFFRTPNFFTRIYWFSFNFARITMPRAHPPVVIGTIFERYWMHARAFYVRSQT